MKIGVTIITLSTLILITSGFLFIKVYVWNGYNEETSIEKVLRNELENVKKDPNNLVARAKLMEGFYKKGLYEEAETQAEYIIAHKKKPSEIKIQALYYHSLVKGIEGEVEEAENDLQEILSIDDQFGEAWLSLASLYVSTGDIPSAEIANEKATALLKDSPETLFLSGKIHYINGNDQAAFKILKQVLKLSPEHVQAKDLLEQVKLGTKGL